MSVTPGRNNAGTGSSIVKRVFATKTGTTASTIWTPATGKAIYLRGGQLRTWVATALVGATPGDGVYVMSATTPFACIAVIKTATDAAGVDYGFVTFDSAGFPVDAINTPLTINTGGTIGAGVIQFCGYVWGDEA